MQEKKNVGIEQDGCNITEARKFSSAEEFNCRESVKVLGPEVR